ncbi:hypothetical protein GF319_07590 [Candidatus Bathyarchaeota archaeon]|nr:hypothetical protein [Candidatus Bathyarchaeota archaeon]
MVMVSSTGLGDVGRSLMGRVSSRVKAKYEVTVRIFNGEGEEIEDVGQGLLS